MEKSEYSGVFGDYSTFSDEMEEDMNASEEAKASDEEDELTEAQAEREEKDDEI